MTPLTQTHQVRLDRWLVASDLAFESLSNFWRTEAGLSSLLDWRLDNKLIEHAPADTLETRLDAFASEASWNIILLVDEANEATLGMLQRRADHLDIHLLEWRQSPLTAVLGMNAPDRAFLSALREAETVEVMKQLPPIFDRQGCAKALQIWERECRENDSEVFAEMLPAYAVNAIPWSRLLGIQGNAEATPPAANDNWVELVRLAASTSSDSAQAISLEDPRNQPAQWTLTLSPIDGGPATLAIFSVNAEAIPAFQGCNIRLRIKGNIVDLGEIDDEGQAETILPDSVEMQGLAISWDKGA